VSAYTAGVTVLEARGLTKIYGTRRAVDDVSFTVGSGEVVGFLGPNGAGKTTTLRMLAGLVRPSNGEARVLGEAVPGPAVARVGAIIEEPSFYPYLSGRENLRYAAMLHGGLPENRLNEVLEQVGLLTRADDRVHKYSQGMRQRLGLARALLNRPAALLLDEPTNGLDPEGVAELREVIHGFAHAGITVLVSSHILAEVERVARRVLIIDKGKLLADGPVADLFARLDAADTAYRVETTEPTRAGDVLRQERWVARVEVVEDGVRVLLPRAAAYRLGPILASSGVPFTELRRDGQSLENLYLQVVGADTPSPAAAQGEAGRA
jgi:ABC-2 type transport system ATP-binding protein